MSGASLSVEARHQARIARQLIRAAGGLEAAEEICGKSKSQLARYQCNNDAASIPLEVVEALESVSGQAIVTRYLAAQAGLALFTLPTITASGSDLLQLVATQAKESGDITNRLITALDDQHLCGKEVSELRREVAELIAAAVAMDAELSAIEEQAA